MNNFFLVYVLYLATVKSDNLCDLVHIIQPVQRDLDIECANV